MKKPVFRLKSLLEYRRFLKTQAAGRLADSSRKRAEAYDSFCRISTLLSELESDLEIRTRSAIRASDLMILQKGLSARRQETEAARYAYERALAEENEWRERILRLQKEFESVLKLKEKHLEQARLEELKEEEMSLNEFTTARFKNTVNC